MLTGGAGGRAEPGPQAGAAGARRIQSAYCAALSSGSTCRKATTSHSSSSASRNSQAGMPLMRMPWRVTQYSSRGRQWRRASTSGPGSGSMLLPGPSGATPGAPWHCTHLSRKQPAPRRAIAASASGGSTISRARSRTEWRIEASSTV